MTDGESLLNKQQRKKVRRKAKRQREREAHRNLDDITGEAITLSLQIAPDVAASRRPRVVEIEIPSVSEAQFVQKRINDALQIGEWLDDVRVALWRADGGLGGPLSDGGKAQGFELRIERALQD